MGRGLCGTVRRRPAGFWVTWMGVGVPLASFQNITVDDANSALPGTEPISQPFKFGIRVNLHSSWLAECFQDSLRSSRMGTTACCASALHIFITFAFLVSPAAVITGGIAGSGFPAGGRWSKARSSLLLALPPNLYFPNHFQSFRS